MVLMPSSAFFAGDLQYSGTTTIPLVRPTADRAALVASALPGLPRIYRQGYQYAKVGVMLVDW